MSEDWRLEATCRGRVDPNLPFFPDNSSEVKKFIADFCHRCPVSGECLSFALETGEKFGVFGGYTPSGRTRLLRHGLRTCLDCPRRFVPVSRVHQRCAACSRRHSTGTVGPVRRHGTRGGYEQHRRRGERSCDPCRAAKTEYDRQVRARGAA